MNDINENHDDDNNLRGRSRGVFGNVLRDTGVQHAAAGVAVAGAIALLKTLFFGSGSR